MKLSYTLRKKKLIINNSTFLLLLFIASIFLGIGYAQISNVNLDINGTATAYKQTGIVITNVTYSNNNNANVNSSNINHYYQTMLDSKVVLGNTLDSTITYNIEITNLTSNDVAFEGVVYDPSFYDNNDITFMLNNLNVGDVLEAGDTISFQITFKYNDNLATITSNNLNSYLNFKFGEVVSGHRITYDSPIVATGYNYPTSVDDHGTVSFYFQGTKPSKVFVDGNLWKGYNMNTGRLVLDDINSDIFVSADFTPVNRAYFATNLSSQMRTLSGGATNVTAIKYSDTIPSGASTINVRKDASSEDIFMWYDNGVIYWNSSCLNPSATGATLYQLFSGYTNLVDISGLETWDTSGATTVLEMFKNDSKLVDASSLRYFDMSSIINMRGMFNGASSLSNITGLDNWDVSNVQDMNSLFVSNYSLIDISPLASWNTRSVKSISGILQECRSLVDISALANWNTSNLTEIVQLLQNTQVSDLTPISNWDVSKVQDMRQFLFKCTKVTSLEPLSSWQTNSLLNLNQAFAQMNSITNFHGLENWNVSNVTNFSNMCDGCTKLNTLEALQNWNVSSGTNFAVMFYGNSSITAQGAQFINGWTLNPTANFNQMFNRVNNKPTFYFDVGGVPTAGTWSSNGTLIVPS